MLVDTRTAFVTKEGEPYVPQNYDRQWRGPVLLRQALASSLNLIAVKVLDYVGLEHMTAQARALGITTFDDADRFGLALTLGGGEVRLLELTAAYAAFANQGYRVQPVIIRRVEDSHGRVLKTQAGAPAVRAMDERVAYLITDILSDNLARLATFGEGSPLHLTRPAAAKTGTTTDWRDNWTVGYTPDLMVGVWAGNADNQPMLHVTGVMGAAPIWHDIMEELLKGRPERRFEEPPGMQHVVVCADSGLLPAGASQQPSDSAAAPVSPVKHSPSPANPAPDGATRQPAPCPRTLDEIFIDGTQPTRTDDWHWWVKIDRRNGLLAGPDCPAQVTTQRLFTLYPAEAQDWVRRQAIPQPPESYSPLCPAAAGERASGGQRPANQTRQPGPYSLLPTPYSLTMTSPDQGSRFLLSPQIPKATQRVAVAVRLADGVRVRQVVLLVDNQPLQTLSRPPYQAFWPMTPGRHVFSARATDDQGNEIEGNSVSIEVVE
jgi:membrane carboxypeptidase/penicillin-binding protein PbpC